MDFPVALLTPRYSPQARRLSLHPRSIGKRRLPKTPMTPETVQKHPSGRILPPHESLLPENLPSGSRQSRRRIYRGLSRGREPRMPHKAFTQFQDFSYGFFLQTCDQSADQRYSKSSVRSNVASINFFLISPPLGIIGSMLK